MLRYLLLFFLAASGADAQDLQQEEERPMLEVSLLGGSTSASLWQSELPDYSNHPRVIETKYDRYELKSFGRVSAAMKALYWFASPLGVEIGVSYQVRGGTIEYEYNLVGYESDGFTRRTVEMLSIPIGLTVRPIRWPISVDLSVGIDYAIPLFAEVQYYSTHVSEEETLTSDSHYDANYNDDIGLYGALGLKYWISERIGVNLQLGYTHGLTSKATGVNLENPLSEPNSAPYQRFRTYHFLAGTSYSW